MNRVILMGRLTKDPTVVTNQQTGELTLARYTLAVDRNVRKDASNGQPTADFISCVAFGKSAEFAQNYLRKGTKIAVEGRIQTGSYQNKEGQTVYTTDVAVDRHEFCESKGSGNGQAQGGGYQQQAQPQGGYQQPADVGDGFMNIPDGLDEELPFN